MRRRATKPHASTRLPLDGSDRPALLRIVSDGEGGELVLELTYRTLTLRPKRARDPDAKVSLSWGGIYQRGLMAAAERIVAARRATRSVRRKR